MELIVNRQPIFINENMLDTAIEQPVECDVLLPENNPDIAKILKCTLNPVVTSTQVQGGRLVVEGEGQVAVHYLSQHKRLCRSDYKVPFSRVLELRGDPSCPVVNAQATGNYINCRMVNNRRLDIRGAATIRLKMMNVKEENPIASAEGMGVQLRKTTRPATRILCQVTKGFTVCEELELTSGKGAAVCILRVDACPKLLDSKVVAGKAILRGELLVHLLYQTEQGGCDTMDYTIPMSHMVDVDGADEQCVCDVRLDVKNVDIEPHSDKDGDARLLRFEALVCATIRVHRSYEMMCAGDCYSTKYECNYQTKAVNTLYLAEVVNRNFVYKDNLDLPEGVNRVADLWCNLLSSDVHMDGNQAVLTGKLNVALFGENNEGELDYFDKVVDFEERQPLPENCNEPMFTPELKVQSCNFATTGAQIELRCEICLNGSLYGVSKMPVVSEIAVDPHKEKAANVSKGLYVYLADEGEGLWDIAKRYNTSVERIMEDNDLHADCTTDRTMLLIPVL